MKVTYKKTYHEKDSIPPECVSYPYETYMKGDEKGIAEHENKSCCDEMENAYNNRGGFYLDDYKAVVLIEISHESIYPINFCPFCGEKIILEEYKL